MIPAQTQSSVAENEVTAPVATVEKTFACKYQDSDLCKFLEQFTKRNPYFLKNTPEKTLTIDKDGNQELLVVESDGNNMQVVRTKNGKEDMQYRIIGNILYNKDYVSNSWKSRTISQEEVDKLDLGYYTNIVENFTDPTNEYLKKGDEKCGSMNCLGYKVAFNKNSEDISSLDIYFDKDEFLLRKVVMNYANKSTQEFIPFYRYGKVEKP